jgi:nucleotide-binding universal stress UspA family protein
LFVPPGGTPPNNWNTIVVAWNGSRESARAITEAMPFLEAAEKVIVVLVDDRHPAEEKGREPGADVARHLSRHSVNAELRHVVEWDHIHAAILNEAEKSGAGLLVMGGYGHSRLREWVIGGATRGVLTEAGLPVLMAH